ncbi:MAG TPA: ATP-binding protein [Solirubrobacteraceae bacterium]|jgi:AAA+ ATPase superfamily predicted ATPase|nr:ATP-binding protein [Solirubrobacteraceae bacterium]
MKFLNRTDELAALEDNWTAADARFYVLWGRRRVGKTELLSHFVRGRRALYFVATDAARHDQLRDLSHELARVWGNELLARQPLTSWEAALAAIAQYAASERTIVVLDEFQYLAAQDRELGSLLNRWWRTAGRRLPLVLVIAGSEVSFFERHVLAGEMYGRRTGQWQLTPFDYRAAALFVPRYSAPDKIRTYAVCGGMPYYLERFDDRVPLGENILCHILRRDGFLHEEAELLLRQELSDPHNYFSTLRAIAAGRTRNSEIMDWTGLDSAQVRQITSVLERLALVEQRRPVTAGPRSRKTTYAILDGFLRFYFRFVDPYRSLLRTHAGAKRHLQRTVLPQLEHFVSKPAFEEICRVHMQRAEQASAVGAWWGPVPTGEGRRTEQRELDAVALDHLGRVLALGSCKWTGAPMGIAEETLLTRLQAHVPGVEAAPQHYFYARAGFAERLRRLCDADSERYKLVAPDDLYD